MAAAVVVVRKNGRAPRWVVRGSPFRMANGRKEESEGSKEERERENKRELQDEVYARARGRCEARGRGAVSQ